MSQETTENTQKTGRPQDYTACTQYYAILDFLGRKWMGFVLSLLATRTYRFNELLEAIPGISDRMLTERLRDLETRHFVVRRVLTSPPIRVEYELTASGKELHKVVTALLQSAEQWFPVE